MGGRAQRHRACRAARGGSSSRAVAATGKPYVVVLVNGRPLVLGDWFDAAPAVLEAWHPGIEAGHAVADVRSARSPRAASCR